LGRAIALLQPIFSQYLEKGFSSHDIAERINEAADFVRRMPPRTASGQSDARRPPKKLTDPKDRERFMQALEEYFSKGTCSVTCDECGRSIGFRPLGATTWKHDCACGKYSATLRGL